MLLKEFQMNDQVKLKKVLRLLKSTYGITINECDNLESVRANQQTSYRALTALKENNVAIDKPQTLKYHLINQAYSLMAKCINETREQSAPKDKQYYKLIERMANICMAAINSGSDHDKIVESALSGYRESLYQYPDTEVEQDLRAFLKQL